MFHRELWLCFNYLEFAVVPLRPNWKMLKSRKMKGFMKRMAEEDEVDDISSLLLSLKTLKSLPLENHHPAKRIITNLRQVNWVQIIELL